MTAPNPQAPGNGGDVREYMEIIDWETAEEMAKKMLWAWLTAEHGQRIVSDFEDPYRPYVQEQNSYSMAGECFSVKCIGIGNRNMTYYREGWDSDGLDDYEVIGECVENGDMTCEIDALTEAIMESWNEGVE